MKVITWFLIILFATFFIYYSTEDAIKRTPEEIMENMTIHKVTFNLTETHFAYTNLYEEEITMKGVVFNIIHPIVYGVMVEINTIVPLVIYTASGNYATLLMKIILLYILLQLLFILPQIIKATIAIYFFIREKKRTKEKWWH